MFNDIKTITQNNFKDKRGLLWTTWKKGIFKNIKFIHDKFSLSKKNVLRGLHGDFSTWKLINCVYGKFYLVVADNRKDSPTYKEWQWFVLSAENRKQVLVPPGCGNAHFVLSDDCTFHYKLAFDGDYNDIDKQFVIKWDDEMWGFEWPHNKPTLFGRDR